ncbi:MAG: site-2 protease family protein [Candidatus Pacebacteria bacterium]|nr:site-2 protease family protein [Candidatus Paceibacterota bacterium]
MQPGDIFQIVVLIFSVVLHEVAHGYMANYLGDPTARLQGRLTLNPLKHIDPMGSVFLPLILKLTGSPILIGYAKPVPYNPYNLKGKWGEALVAFAGPGTNILLALIFGLIIRVFGGVIDPTLLGAFAIIAFINMLLALFNLIPIPPLDGSKILSELLPGELGRAYGRFRESFERLGVLTGTLIILVLFYFLSPYFGAFLGQLFGLLTGLSF